MSDLPLLIMYTFLIILPFLLTAWLAHHFKVRWKVFWIGVLVFIIADIFHSVAIFGLSRFVDISKWHFAVTTTWVIFSATTGLLSSLLTESLRWAGFHWAKSSGKPYGASLVLASGSGGAGMVGTVFTSFFIWAVLALIACSGGSSGHPIHLPLVNYDLQFTNCTSSPSVTQPSIINILIADLTFILDYLAPMSIHFAASIMVWMAIQQRKAAWFLAALVWHMLAFGTYVYITGFAYLPWTITKPTLPYSVIPIGTTILIVLNIVFIIWSYRSAKEIEKISEIPSPAEKH